MSDKPLVFIGSSSQGEEIARAVAEGLADVATVKLWSEQTFQLSKVNLENLESIAAQVEFAVLVLTADDTRRDGATEEVLVPRDNLVFELGLFMGKLGRERTFALRAENARVKLPSDLAGADIPTFAEISGSSNPHDRKRALREAVSTAVGRIREAIARVPPFVVRRPSSEIVKVYPQRRHVSPEEWRGFIRSATRHLWLYGMVEGGYARDADTARTFLNVPADCDVRVLLLDPESQPVAEIDKDEGLAEGTLKHNILTALGLFAKMRHKRPGQIKIRTYAKFPQTSIVRADGRALLTNYIRPLAGDDCPTLEVHGQAEDHGGLLGGYVQHFHEVWNGAKEWGT